MENKETRELQTGTGMTQPDPGHRIYERIRLGTLTLADTDYVNSTLIQNQTFILPVQPPPTRIYKALVTGQPCTTSTTSPTSSDKKEKSCIEVSSSMLIEKNRSRDLFYHVGRKPLSLSCDCSIQDQVNLTNKLTTSTHVNSSYSSSSSL